MNIDGVTGYTSGVGMVDKMAEDVMRIFESEETLQRFRENALKQAERFDIAQMIPKYEAYYQKVMAESRAKPEESLMDC